MIEGMRPSDASSVLYCPHVAVGNLGRDYQSVLILINPMGEDVSARVSLFADNGSQIGSTQLIDFTPGHRRYLVIDRLFELSQRHAVESTVIGTYTDSGKLHITFDGKTCAYVDLDLLKSGFPQWEFEAEFRDENGREFGEFDIELSRVAKKESEDTFKADFRMRHESLEFGQRVQVYLDDDLVLEGNVEKAGRIWLSNDHVVTALTTASAGQICRIRFGGVERFAEAIVPD